MFYRLFATFILMISSAVVYASDCYVWQREHNPFVGRAVTAFHRAGCGRLFYLAGEIENSGRIIRVSPPEYLVRGESGAVVRIHVMEMRRSSPQKLAEKVSGIYAAWRDAGCDEFQIDLDAPEKRIDYYTQLMRALRKLLPDGTRLSATVLPCHTGHFRAFSLLARSVDYFVLQVHYLQTKGGKNAIFDFDTACCSIVKAQKFCSPFKVALPLYTMKIRGETAVCDWQEVSACAGFCRIKRIPVVGFRLGNGSDPDSLDLKTAQDILNGLPYRPRLDVKVCRENNNTYTLYVTNYGHLCRRMTVNCSWKNSGVITDCDTLNGSRSNGSLPPSQLDIELPHPGCSLPVLWMKTSGDVPPDITFKMINKEPEKP